ncbi:LTR transposable element, partial [Pseudoloma neurophilia]
MKPEHSSTQNRSTSTQYSKTYCKYHKTRYHDTKDCKFLQAQKSRNTENNSKTYNIGSNNKNDFIYVPIIFQNKPFQAIADTGSELSFIHMDILKASDLKTKKTKPINIQFANSLTEEISDCLTVEIVLTIDNKPITRQITFFVSDKLPCAAILGMDFLSKNFDNIDLTNKVLFLKSQSPSLQIEHPENSKKNDSNRSTELEYLMLQFDQLINKCSEKSKNLNAIDNSIFEIILSSEEPIQCKEYPVPLAEREKLKEHLKDLIDKKIIQISDSNYSSPAFTTKKPNGDIRLLIDYRKLNLLTITQPYPFPSIRDQFLDLKGAKIFSLID